MPGPVITRTSLYPEWAQPENASVFDPPYRAPLRTIIRLLGLDDPQQVMMLGTPLEPPNPELGGLLGEVAKRFPRLVNAIKAYHGSPHDFEQFSMEKIGTGEGAQAYGHGLYFAESPGVAQSYRDRLSGTAGYTPGASQGVGKLMVGDVPAPAGIAGHRALDTAQDIQGLLYYKKNGYNDMADVLRNQIEQRIKWWREGNPGTGIADEDMRQLVNYYEQHVKSATPDLIRARPPGKMYEVNIHADPAHFLDWDKPLEQQSAPVQEVALKLLRSADLKPAAVGHGKYGVTRVMPDGSGMIVRGIQGDTPEAALRNYWDTIKMMKGEELYQEIARNTATSGAFPEIKVPRPANASAALREAGIPGIKYLDQSSRAAGEGTRNYVVFDDQLIDILKKYGIALPLAGAAYQSAQPQR